MNSRQTGEDAGEPVMQEQCDAYGSEDDFTGTYASGGNASAGSEAGGEQYHSRNFKAEIDELLREYPDALSAGGLPEDVRRDALAGKNVTVAYAQSRARAIKAELDALRGQREAAAKAPVRSMYRPASEAAADDFTRGFDSEKY